MCKCNMPNGNVCVNMFCSVESKQFVAGWKAYAPCTVRAADGPSSELPACAERRTGRTTRGIYSALLAAMSGKRVVHLSSKECLARDACRAAVKLLEEIPGGFDGQRAEMTADSITLYYLNGSVRGIIKFRSMYAHDINRGLRDSERYIEVADHHVAEVLAEKARKEARSKALEQIRDLMLAHEISRIEVLNRVHTAKGTVEFFS